MSRFSDIEKEVEEGRERPPFYTAKSSKKGPEVVIACGENILMAVQHCFPGRLRFNSWVGRKEFKGNDGVWVTLTDYHHMLVRSEIQKEFSDDAIRKVSATAAQLAVDQCCFENEYDEVREYFKALKGTWDGTPRLATWINNTYGTPDDVYHRAVGANFLKGMVKRALYPGTKFDYVLVLEGPQGIGKSTSLSVLGGNWHTETTISPDNKDFYMALQGHLIVEFSEGETLSRSEVKQLKAVISATKDTFRPPYGRETLDFPRRCVFAMTTNQNEYLKDETGNRRWLPVECKDVNIEWLKENRDQLFAEALARVEAGETIHEFPREETIQAQAARMVEDPDTEKVFDWYFLKIRESEREEGISTEQAFQGIQPVQGLNYNKMNRAEQMRIGSILRNTLCLERKKIWNNGTTVWRYVPTEKTRKMAPEPSPYSIDAFDAL